MKQSIPKIYSVTEAAEYLRLSPIRVRQFCQEGRIGKKAGAFWVIFEPELQRFAREKRPAGGNRKKNENGC